MSQPAAKRAVYEDLYKIPEDSIGEIIDGELIVTPRPSRRHVIAASYLGSEVIPPYCRGRGGGPGGWIILIEPEIGLGESILVPDLAGWKRERFPDAEVTNWISAVPDWVCEVLSPDTARNDKIKKMRVYAGHEVPYAWLLDPFLLTLESSGSSPAAGFCSTRSAKTIRCAQNHSRMSRLTLVASGCRKERNKPGKAQEKPTNQTDRPPLWMGR